MKTGPALPLTRPSILRRIAEACRALRDYFCTDYDGIGGYEANSSRIPPGAWLGAVIVLGVAFWALLIGAVVGF